jgi:hypothetical protein
MMVRQLGLIEKVLEEKARELIDATRIEWMCDLDQVELERKWKQYIKFESYKRSIVPKNSAFANLT